MLNPYNRDYALILFQQHSEETTETFWVNTDCSPCFRITQEWSDGGENTVYLRLYELEEIVETARKYTEETKRV